MSHFAYLQDFGVDSFHLDDVLSGVVRFIGISKPITAAHVSFARKRAGVWVVGGEFERVGAFFPGGVGLQFSVGVNTGILFLVRV